MTIFSWRSRKHREWRSSEWLRSEVRPGVEYQIARMSLERRGHLLAELHRAVREMNFHDASEELCDKLQAGVLRTEIERTYLRCGLLALRHLRIDGASATPEALAARGPEDLCHEIAGAIRRECGLSEEERKN